MVNVEQTQTPEKPNLLVPVLGLSLFALASGYLMSLIPLSLSFFQLDTQLAPLLASIFYFGLLLGAPSIAPIVARMGHRKAFILFLNILLCTVVAMAIVPDSLLWLLARLIAGFAVAGVFVVVESWLLMADTQKQRAKRLGLYMTALYGGTAIGQLAVDHIGTAGHLPYLVVMGLLAVASLPALLIKKGQPQQSESHTFSLSSLKSLSRPAIAGCLVSGLLLGPIYGLLPIYVSQDMGYSQQTGLFMALIIVGGMLVQPLVSYLSPRLHKGGLMACFCLLGLLALLMMVQSSLLSVRLGFILLGACAFALYPIAISLACDALPQSKIVSATQIMLLSYAIGSVCGPMLASRFDTIAHGLLVYLAASLVITALYLLSQALPQQKPKWSAP